MGRPGAAPAGRTSGAPLRPALLVAALHLLIAASAAAWTVGGRVTASAGRESDLTLQPGPAPAVVPGGPFLGLVAALDARTGRDHGTRLDLGLQGWHERFTDADGRNLDAGTAALDLHRALGPAWGLRLGAGANLFDDSARPTARRTAGWVEAGLVWSPGPWRLEGQAGLEGRRYGQLTAPDAAGVPGVYTERHASAGLHAAVRIGGRARLRAAWHHRVTTARDPAYDAEGPTFEAGGEVALVRGVRLLADGFLQERRFTARPADRDRDRYGQVGGGVEVDLAARWAVRATAVASRYRWPDGTEIDTQRVQLAVTWRLGAAAVRGLPPPGGLPRAADPTLPRAGHPVGFRLRAPDAAAVVLVGDFNGWDPAATPLWREGDGWWRTEVRLPAGTHAYAYVVDGRWLTPPEAAATAPDGFGGRNGLIVVLP